MQTEGKPVQAAAEHGLIDSWILSRMNRMVAEVETQLADYRLDLAAQALYEFTWNEYCDWYLELSKATLQSNDESVQAATRHTLLHVLETTLRTMHPIMPFITEEIWQRVKPLLGMEGETIMLQPFPEADEPDAAAESDVEWLQAVIQGVRRIRSELNLPPGKPLDVCYQGGGDVDRTRQQQFGDALASLARIQSSEWVDDTFDTAQCAVSLVGDLKVLIPLKGLVDVDEELARLNRQLEKEKAELKKSEGKLGNSRFVDNAPAAVVEQERQRLTTHKANVGNLLGQIEQMEALRG
jgi:valyl-tRNA synthetase